MGVVKKERIIAFCDKIIEIFIYILIFALPFSIAVIEISATFIILAWVLTRVLKRQLPASTYLNIPIMIYIAAVFLSVLFSSNFPLSWKNFWAKTMEYILLFLIIAEVGSRKKKLENIIIVLFVSALMIGVDCVFQYFVGVDLLRFRHLESGRLTGSFQMPGDLAGFLGPVFALVLSLSFLKLKKGAKSLLTVESILLFSLLIMIIARGAWFGLIGAVCFLGVLENKKIAYFAVAFLLIGGITITYFVDIPLGIVERLKSIFICSHSSLDRRIIWHAAIQMIKDKPLFGHGLSTFMGKFPAYGQDYYYLKEGVIPYAHNCYLQLAAETGITGLLSFLLLLWMFLTHTVRSLTKKIKNKFQHAVLSGVSAGIIATLIHSAVDTNLYSLQLSVLFWIMLGLNAALQQDDLGKNITL